MDAILADLVDRARHVRMTDAERRAQRINFAYGNAHLENPAVTREMVVLASRRLEMHGAQTK